MLEKIRTAGTEAGSHVYTLTSGTSFGTLWTDVLRRIKHRGGNRILIGPGSLFTSIEPHFLVDQMAEALRQAKNNNAQVILVMNATYDNETTGYDVIGLLENLERLIKKVTDGKGIKLDDVIGNLIVMKNDGHWDSSTILKLMDQAEDRIAQEPEFVAALKRTGGNKDDKEKHEAFLSRRVALAVAQELLDYDDLLAEPIARHELDPMDVDMIKGLFDPAKAVDVGRQIVDTEDKIKEGEPEFKESDLLIRATLEVAQALLRDVNAQGERVKATQAILLALVEKATLLQAVYPKVEVAIRTNANEAADAAKKSRGPMMATLPELKIIRNRWRNLNVVTVPPTAMRVTKTQKRKPGQFELRPLYDPQVIADALDRISINLASNAASIDMARSEARDQGRITPVRRVFAIGNALTETRALAVIPVNRSESRNFFSYVAMFSLWATLVSALLYPAGKLLTMLGGMALGLHDLAIGPHWLRDVGIGFGVFFASAAIDFAMSGTRRSEARMSTQERALINDQLQVITDHLAAREEYVPNQTPDQAWTPVTLEGLKLDPSKKNLAMILGTWDDRTAHEAGRVIKSLQARGFGVTVLTSGKYGNKPGVYFDAQGNRLAEAVHYRNILEAQGVSVRFVEPDSVDTGKNILYSKAKLDEAGYNPDAILLMQNPLLQRRAGLSIVRQYFGSQEAFDASGIRLISYTPYVPEVLKMSDEEALQTLEYALREVASLKVYPQKGYTIPNPIPEQVLQAEAVLVPLAESLVVRSEMRGLPSLVAQAASKLMDHLSMSSRNLPKDPVVVVLGNPLKQYPEYVAQVLGQLKPSKVLIVGNGVNLENRKTDANPNGQLPEFARLESELKSKQRDGKISSDITFYTDHQDNSMNTGDNIEPVISILNREKLSPKTLVLVQAPQGLRVSQRIFLKQWDSKKEKASVKPRFLTYALPSYVAQVKEFLSAGFPALAPRIMFFEKGGMRPLQGLLKDILGQVWRLRNWNKKHINTDKAKDLPADVVASETVLKRHDQKQGALFDRQVKNLWFEDLRTALSADDMKQLVGLASHDFYWVRITALSRLAALTAEEREQALLDSPDVAATKAEVKTILDSYAKVTPQKIKGQIAASEKALQALLSNPLLSEQQRKTEFRKTVMAAVKEREDLLGFTYATIARWDDRNVDMKSKNALKFTRVVNRQQKARSIVIWQMIADMALLSEKLGNLTTGLAGAIAFFSDVVGQQLPSVKEMELSPDFGTAVLRAQDYKRQGRLEDADKAWVAAAEAIAKSDKRTKVLNTGAVVVSANGEVLGIGYNGEPFGQLSDTVVMGDDIRRDDFMQNIKGSTPRFVDGQFALDLRDNRPDQRLSICAEQRAIIAAILSGKDLKGAVLYASHSPCNQCVLTAFNAGMRKIRFGSGFADQNTDILLKRIKEFGLEMSFASVNPVTVSVKETLVGTKTFARQEIVDRVAQIVADLRRLTSVKKPAKDFPEKRAQIYAGFAKYLLQGDVKSGGVLRDVAIEMQRRHDAEVLRDFKGSADVLRFYPQLIGKLEGRADELAARSEFREMPEFQTGVEDLRSQDRHNWLGPIGTAVEVAARTVSRDLLGSSAYAAEIKPVLFADTVHFQKIPAIPERVRTQTPKFTRFLEKASFATAGRSVTGQLSGLPKTRNEVLGLLPLVTFAQQNPKVEISLAITGTNEKAVNLLRMKLAVMFGAKALPGNLKIQAFADLKAFRGVYDKVWNEAGNMPMAFVTDGVDGAVRGIGGRNGKLLRVAASSRILDLAVAMMGSAVAILDARFVESHKDGFMPMDKLNIHELMTELSGYVTAQAKLLASA